MVWHHKILSTFDCPVSPAAHKCDVVEWHLELLLSNGLLTQLKCQSTRRDGEAWPRPWSADPDSCLFYRANNSPVTVCHSHKWSCLCVCECVFWTDITWLGPTQPVQVSLLLRGSCRTRSHFHQQQLTGMMCYHLLSWAALLVASGPLLGHPITESAEMPYAGPGEWIIISSSPLFSVPH